MRVNLQKTRVHGYAHAIRAILHAGTVLASIKFKSSCTVCPEKFAAQRAESFVVTGQDHNSDLPISIDLSTAQSSTQMQHLDTNNTTDLTQSLLASEEKVILQTAIVLIQSVDGKLGFYWIMPIKEHS